MRKYVRLLVSLVVAGVITFFLFTTAQGAGNDIEYRSVAVVKAQIKQNELVTSKNIEIKQAPLGMVPENTLDSIPQGKVALVDLYPGQYLLPQMLSNKKTTDVGPRHRIYPIPVDVRSVGQIKKGDLVDILWFPNQETGNGQPVNISNLTSKVVLSGVEIDNILTGDGHPIAERDDAKGLSGSRSEPGILEVLVTVDEALLLNKYANTGHLSTARYMPQSEPVAALSR
ncbi:MAG: hypothetical protein H0Z39_10840 [Peptococcaceae bacterium]|nr:hypothetical protein [Peptococcaceae bacterium]